MRLLLLLLFMLSCSSSASSPYETSPSTLPLTKSKDEATQLVKQAAPMLLKIFRPRMSFLTETTTLAEETNAFAVTVQIEYQSFFKQAGRTAKISFLLGGGGLVSRCRIQDPVHKAAEVSCSQLETKISQLFISSF